MAALAAVAGRLVRCAHVRFKMESLGTVKRGNIAMGRPLIRIVSSVGGFDMMATVSHRAARACCQNAFIPRAGAAELTENFAGKFGRYRVKS